MRLFRTATAVIIASVFSLCMSSCEKEPLIRYADTTWEGYYSPASLQDTYEVRSTSFMLFFSEDALKCTVQTGTVGLISMNRISYLVEWTGTDSFSLYEELNGQKTEEYRGTVAGDALFLEILYLNSEDNTVKLTRSDQKH